MSKMQVSHIIHYWFELKKELVDMEEMPTQNLNPKKFLLIWIP